MEITNSREAKILNRYDVVWRTQAGREMSIGDKGQTLTIKGRAQGDTMKYTAEFQWGTWKATYGCQRVNSAEEPRPAYKAFELISESDDMMSELPPMPVHFQFVDTLDENGNPFLNVWIYQYEDRESFGNWNSTIVVWAKLRDDSKPAPATLTKDEWKRLRASGHVAMGDGGEEYDEQVNNGTYTEGRRRGKFTEEFGFRRNGPRAPDILRLVNDEILTPMPVEIHVDDGKFKVTRTRTGERQIHGGGERPRHQGLF